MTYSIKFSSKAKRFLKSLDKNKSLRILDKLEEIKKDPFRYLEHFEGDGYKLRIGDFRALIDIDFKDEILKIRLFDKRGKIYK